MSILDEYTIDYHITCLPSVLYAGLHKASDIPEFSGFTIPEDLRQQPIECRFALYNKSGELIELASQMAPGMPLAISKVINMIPLRMVDKLVQGLKQATK